MRVAGFAVLALLCTEGCKRTPTVEIRSDPVTANDVATADQRDHKLRAAVDLPDRSDADMVDVSVGREPFRGDMSVEAVREPSGDWTVEQVDWFMRPPAHYTLQRRVIHGDQARRLDILAAEAGTIERSGSIKNCLDGDYGLVRVRWRGHLRSMRIACDIAGPAREMLNIVLAEHETVQMPGEDWVR